MTAADDRYEQDRQLTLRAVGGSFTNKAGGTTVVRWCTEIPRYDAIGAELATARELAKLEADPTHKVVTSPVQELIAQRVEILDEMKRIKSRRAPVPNPDVLRRRREAEAERVLAEPDNPEPASCRKWLVRIYYLSAGDEVLCFDAGPFVEVVAARVQAEENLRCSEPTRPQKARTWRAERFLADEVGPDARAQGRVRAPWHGARLVKLPSQHAHGVEVATCE